MFVCPPLLTCEAFRYQKEQLSDSFRVITYDIRGHGQSESSDVPLSIPLLAEDIKQLMDVLNIRQTYICGYSTGGQLALEAMMTYPDRFLGGIIVSGMSEVSEWYSAFRISLAGFISGMRLKRLLCSAISWGNADCGKTFRQLYGYSVKGNIKNLSQYYHISKRYNCTSRLHTIKVPVLLIYGNKDKSFLRYARILQRHIPHCTLHLLEGATHQIPTKRARDMNNLIRLWIRGELVAVSPQDEHVPFLSGATDTADDGRMPAKPPT